MWQRLDRVWGGARQIFLEQTGFTQARWGATEVAPGVFVGNLASAFDKEELEKHKIEAIVCCVRGVFHTALPTLHVELTDNENEDFKQYFNEIIEFANKYERVLYHCSFGVSRSTTAALAVVLSRDDDILVTTALENFRLTRPSCRPNDNFIGQVIDWRTDVP
jgi:protein-tyrosine phosphatase